MLKPETTFVKFLEPIKIICCQNNARMHIVMVSFVCSIAYKNVTSGTRNGAQLVFTLKTSLRVKQDTYKLL